MRPQSKKRELTLLVLSGEGQRMHSVKLSRARLWLLISGWLLLLALAALAGFAWSGSADAQGASGVAVSADARQ